MNGWLRGLGALLILCQVGPARATPCAGLALVLAIDASSSVDEAEFALQIQATAAAVAHPSVVSAMRASGGVALAALVWGDSAWGAQVSGWHFVAGPRDAQEFAARLLQQPRRVGGNTDLGEALDRALDLLDHPSLCAGRRVIDVSGDGRETLYAQGRVVTLREARDRAALMGVQINGLAIASDDPDLPAYYASQLIVGEGAFVLGVRDLDSFAEAMTRKLLREIGDPLTVAALP